MYSKALSKTLRRPCLRDPLTVYSNGELWAAILNNIQTYSLLKRHAYALYGRCMCNTLKFGDTCKRKVKAYVVAVGVYPDGLSITIRVYFYVWRSTGRGLESQGLNLLRAMFHAAFDTIKSSSTDIRDLTKSRKCRQALLRTRRQYPEQILHCS
jgi:hypothetical protein